MTVVLQATTQQLSQIAQHYSTASKKKLAKGTVFQAKIPGVTITGYRSGKVMFQGQLADQEAAQWANLETVHQSTGNHFQSSPDLPPHFAQLAVLGSDEVGTGSYFGPLTTAAVFVDQQHLAPLQKMGVEDSKKLTDPTIIKIAQQIMKLCPYHVVNLHPHDYNRLIQKYNQAQLKAICHNFVLGKVLQKIAPVKPKAILIDQFVSAQTYFNYIKDQQPIISNHVYFKEKGESYHLAVAAASIVARYVSLQTMDELSAKAGVSLPIGSGTKVDQVAADLLKRGLPLDQFVKLHFSNTQRVKQLASQR